MDTKLKSFKGNKIVERVAFILCVVLFLSSLTGFGLIYKAANVSTFGTGIDDLLLYDSYENSAIFQREFDEKLSSIFYLLDEYKSEEYIRSGKTISEQRLDDAMRELYYNGSYSYYHSYTGSGGNTVEKYGSVEIEESGPLPYERYGGRNFEESGLRSQFQQDYKDQIEQLKQAMIMDDLRVFESLQGELDRIKGFTYLATDGTYTVSNIGSTVNTSPAIADINNFRKAPAYLIYENDDLLKNPAAPEGVNGSMEYFDKNLEASLDDRYNPDLNVYFSFDQSFLDAKEAEFSKAKSEIVKWIPMAVGCALLSLILLIYLFAVTGKRDDEGADSGHRVDRVFTEIQLLIIGILLFGGGSFFTKFLYEAVSYGISFNGSIYCASEPLYLSIAIASIIGLFSAFFGLYFILSVVRNVKAGRFLGNSLIFIVLHALWNGLKEFYRGGSVMKKVILITLGVCLASATIVLAPVVLGLVLVFAPRWVKKYEEIKKGVEEVKNGNLAYKIRTVGDGELDQLAKGINEISEASNIAIQNELKNQRLKTDLISNVSHDLKTPLTSIITYIDLLKQEGLDSSEAPKYLEILDQKSIRLKKLTEDLFDAAKASSGAIPVRFEKVEMLSLINQGLGEMNDRIEASNLEFRINAQQEKYFVRADGQLLWRVVENLLGNVLKYAQEGSRVYIDLREQNGKNGAIPNVIMEIKNISKAELNIDAEELMERFKRGDESRTTEGSGLGLAIAKDLVRLQNGWFEIRIDGDLFKAVVMLEAYTGVE